LRLYGFARADESPLHEDAVDVAVLLGVEGVALLDAAESDIVLRAVHVDSVGDSVQARQSEGLVGLVLCIQQGRGSGSTLYEEYREFFKEIEKRISNGRVLEAVIESQVAALSI
jgi:hypothetical protein